MVKYELIDPIGDLHSVNNLAEFCREYGLNYSSMLKLCTCNTWSYSDWVLNRRFDRDDCRKFVSPEGEEFATTNMAEFCRKHDLIYQSMLLLSKDKLITHRGWTRLGAIKPKVKPHVFVSPEGDEFTVNSLVDFCREHNLTYRLMLSLRNGNVSSHKGWTLPGVDKPKVKKHVFVSPEGEEFATTNMAEFCREHGLTYQCVISLSKGDSLSHKGWTRHGANERNIREFRFLDPDGKEVVTTSIAELCREHDLGYQSMILLNTRKRHTHKGWRLSNTTK